MWGSPVCCILEICILLGGRFDCVFLEKVFEQDKAEKSAVGLSSYCLHLYNISLGLQGADEGSVGGGGQRFLNGCLSLTWPALCSAGSSFPNNSGPIGTWDELSVS